MGPPTSTFKLTCPHLPALPVSFVNSSSKYFITTAGPGNKHVGGEKVVTGQGLGARRGWRVEEHTGVCSPGRRGRAGGRCLGDHQAAHRAVFPRAQTGACGWRDSQAPFSYHLRLASSLLLCSQAPLSFFLQCPCSSFCFLGAALTFS